MHQTAKSENRVALISLVWYNLNKSVWGFSGIQGRTGRYLIRRAFVKSQASLKTAATVYLNYERVQWEEHILRERTRWYLKGQFNKVVETLANPDYILQSPKEQNVASYVKRYDDLHILNTIMARAYLYVLVNLNNNNIRTVYSNPGLKEWVSLWRKK